jgi:hypothetical protein
MANTAQEHSGSLRNLEAAIWDEVINAHEAVLCSSEYNREAAWSRFLNALLLFFSEQPGKDS